MGPFKTDAYQGCAQPLEGKFLDAKIMKRMCFASYPSPYSKKMFFQIGSIGVQLVRLRGVFQVQL